MWHAASRLQCLFALGLLMATAGFAMILIPDDGTDRHFEARILRASYSGRGRPVVLIDEGHGNEFTVQDRFQPLARLLKDDGYLVGPNLRPVTKDSLRGVAVLVVARPTTWIMESAFSESEVSALRRWVEGGGSLLLAIDAGASAAAARRLAGAFGVRLGDGEDGRREHLLVRAKGHIGPHAITDEGLRVERLMCFGWQSVAGAGAAFLRVADGHALGVALQVGRGRVAVLGNAAMITALRHEGTAVGFNRGGNDNVRLTLNLLHWLSRL